MRKILVHRNSFRLKFNWTDEDTCFRKFCSLEQSLSPFSKYGTDHMAKGRCIKESIVKLFPSKGQSLFFFLTVIWYFEIKSTGCPIDNRKLIKKYIRSTVICIDRIIWKINYNGENSQYLAIVKFVVRQYIFGYNSKVNI
jgi:hypothetical protein